MTTATREYASRQRWWRAALSVGSILLVVLAYATVVNCPGKTST